MSLITEIDAIIDANIPDNSEQLITEAKMREVLKAISSRLEQLVPVYIRIDLDGQSKLTSATLKVATERLMIINEGTVVSSGPVNDDPDAPNNWPYPGGATPTSWSHNQVTGTLYLPNEMYKVEIHIRPIIG